MEKPLFVSVKEAVRLTGLSRTTVYAMLARGALETTTRGRRRLIVRASIDALLPPSVNDQERESEVESGQTRATGM